VNLFEESFPLKKLVFDMFHSRPYSFSHY